MHIALLLAMTVSAQNLRGTTQARANVTVAPIVTLPAPLSASQLGGSLTLAPSPLAASNSPLPTLAPHPALAAASAAPAPLAAAPDAPSPAASPAEPSSLPALSAAAEAPEQPGLRPAGAAPASAPSFVTRTLAALGRIVNPFGGGKKAEEPPPASEAERLDREFSQLDLWGPAAARAREEIAGARARRMSKAAFKEYVQNEAAAAFERIKAARGVSNVGFHYNLHGGQRKDYVGKGIHASMGDIALRYGGGDDNYKVYFFQTAEHHPYVPLDASNGEIMFLPSRMGHVLNFFDVDAPAILAGKAAGRIREHGAISMDFHGMGGIPYSAYLAPPIEVFNGSAKKAVGLGRLSRDEETLATLRYIEAVLLAGAPYIPR